MAESMERSMLVWKDVILMCVQGVDIYFFFFFLFLDPPLSLLVTDELSYNARISCCLPPIKQDASVSVKI